MRIANRILAVGVALAVAAAGFVVAAEIVLAGMGREPWIIPHDGWYDSARTNQWDSAGVRWMSLALCAAGLAVLAMQLVKGPPRSVALQPGRSEAGLSRRSLEQALARSAQRVDGVSAARVAVDEDRARITVDTNRRTGDLGPAVEQAVRRRLDRAGLARPPQVTVAVNTQDR